MKFFLPVLAFLFLTGSSVVHAAEAGCTLVLSYPDKQILMRDGVCDERMSPMSSFKIPLAAMGYDAGILRDADNPLWLYEEGFTVNKADDLKATDPTSWEKNSVVWYSQKLTGLLGMERFQAYVDRFKYGNSDLTGHPGKKDGLTEAWLMSSLKISPLEQADFIFKLLNDDLGVSARAGKLTRAIIPSFKGADGWDVQGKTGSGWWITDVKGVPDKSKPLGWFVGWATKGERAVVFVRLYKGDKKSDTYGGMIARDDLLRRLPDLVKPQ